MRAFLVALLWSLAAMAGAVRAETLYFIHVDHLGTPRLAIGEDGVERWRWDQLEPFGDNVPIKVMGPEGYLVNLPLRLPGQYADKETNLHYNYFRDYDSGIGRYVQSDPIGLEGGLNTYGYVAANPLRLSDVYGLDYWVEGAVPGEAGWGRHQSICVGKRGGRRTCISFGRRGGNCLFNCDGHIYVDRSAPGDIYRDYFRETNPQTDRQIRNYFNMLVGTRGTWNVIGGSCRDFSQDLFDELVRTWGGQAGFAPGSGSAVPDFTSP